MRRYLLLVLVYLLCIALSYGQSVVYVNKTTGNYGIGYNTDGMAELDGKPTSVEQIKSDGLAACGKGCELIFESKKAGWLAVISGNYITTNKVLVAISDGKETPTAAEDDARKKYKAAGGKDADQIKANTRLVYNTAFIHPSIKYFKSLDSLINLYNLKKIPDIQQAITRMEKSSNTGLKTTVTIKQPLSIVISRNVFDSQSETLFYKCLEQDGLITTLSQMYAKNKLKFTTYHIPGTAGANYDPDAMPDYGFNNTDTKSLANYMKMIVAMTKTPGLNVLLLQDKNDLASYQAKEKASKIPTLIMRRKFILFLHDHYHIPYPNINVN